MATDEQVAVQIGFDIVEPQPGALIESLRAFGYSPQTAVADLIDNSISAGAKQIWIDFEWNGSDSVVCIRDDGRGMDVDTVINAMRTGNQNPLEERDGRDLGRFGLGLKTASFSQCRLLTVGSKPSRGELTIRRWDLDYVNNSTEWRLLHGCEPQAQPWMQKLREQDSGTVVLWQRLDRLVEQSDVGNQKAQKRFYEVIHEVEQHLAMIFHRYLERPNALTIMVNGHRLIPWDPFMTDESATQNLPPDTLWENGQSVTVRPHVLPHQSKLTQEAHERGKGTQGWNGHQGFYVYRNRRLLVAGDWLGLGYRKEEHYKLARIAIDLPNSLDQEWDIDVKKSRARPPGELRDELRRIAKLTRERAIEVYRHRGKVIARRTSESTIFIWNRLAKDGKIGYHINREQPLVTALMQAPEPYRSQAAALLKLLEETIPVALITLDAAQQPESHNEPFAEMPIEEAMAVLSQSYHVLRKQGLSHMQARERLLAMEPFQHQEALLKAFDQIYGKEA